jgi:hypothetical protein
MLYNYKIYIYICAKKKIIKKLINNLENKNIMVDIEKILWCLKRSLLEYSLKHRIDYLIKSKFSISFGF